MCGKNKSQGLTTRYYSGSPPRVREKLEEASASVVKARITPACAGKTVFFFDECSIYQDHPRVCGKNLTLCIYYIIVLGSPPRVREKRTSHRPKLFPPGITPACAGKTRFCWRCLGSCRDHPRVCGKNAINTLVRQYDSGSPPRVREKH